MTKKYRTFKRDFKMSVLAELNSGKKISQIAREHDLHPSLIYRWQEEYTKNPDNAFAGHGKVCKEEAKIAQLERMLGQLYAENEFLKKALRALEERNVEKRTQPKQRSDI
jgi:transposase